jgi:hypothetical protein
VSPEQDLRDLLDLAAEVRLRVREIRGAARGDFEPQAASAVCVVRGETWVVLSGADPLPERIAVLARALRELRASDLDARFLSPRLRELIDPA